MSKSTRLSLTKHVQKKKVSAAAKILPGQRLMSSYFSVVNNKSTALPKLQENRENDDDIEIIEVKKENKTESDKSQVLRELPVCHPAKKTTSMDTACRSDKTTSDKTGCDKSTRDKAASENTMGDKTASDRTASDRTGCDKSTRDKAASENTMGDKTASDRTASNRTGCDKSTRDKAASENTMGDKTVNFKTSSDRSKTLKQLPGCRTIKKIKSTENDSEIDEIFSDKSKALKKLSPSVQKVLDVMDVDDASDRSEALKKLSPSVQQVLDVMDVDGASDRSEALPDETLKKDSAAAAEMEVTKSPCMPAAKLDDSTKDIFCDDDSPGGTKRKRSSSLFSDDLDFLAQLSDLDFSACQTEKYEALSLSEIQRCEVVSVQREAGAQIVELTLCANKKQRATCALLHTWAYECVVTSGLIVSVRAAWSATAQRWEVRDDEEHTVLVEHPDLLLGCTSVMSGLRCRRAAVLGERFKGLGFGDEKGYMILGQLLHELTQQCLQTGTFMVEDIIEKYSALLSRPRVAKQLYSLGHKRSDLETWAEPYYSSISRFMRRHASPQGIPPELVAESQQVKGHSDVWPGTITKVVDIEDTIWLPQLGLKGKLDVTCKVKVHPHMMTKELPVELKTGQSSDNVAHRGQLMFYNAMMSEVENRRVDSGLLVYLKDCLVREVRPVPGERRDAIIMRNEIARHLANKPRVCEGTLQHAPLPPPISRARECSFCPYVDVCSAYISQEGLEDSLSENMPQKVRLQCPDFTQAHRDYFIHWTCLVQLEEHIENPMTKLWTSTLQQRESAKEGCVAGLDVIEQVTEEDRFTTTLVKQNGDSLLSCGFNPGDLVVIGNSQRLVIELANIVSISAASITVTVVKDITARFGKAGFHLDLYKSVSSMSNKLSALGMLMANSPEAARLRSIIIDRAPAVFKPNLDFEIATQRVPDVISSLNEDQTQALRKVLEARDFTLIRGLPGTGKTSSIVSLVLALVALNRSVVITSHTNSAVDNVLERLLKHDVPLLRLGSSSRAVPALLPHCEDSVLGHVTRTEQFDTLYKQRIVVGVTCASSGHVLLKKRKFDVCIVDEATQVHQPALLATLLSASTFVLVGDPDQLQPVVTNQTARQLGMTETLFERLATPDNTVVLGCQYRMNQTICDLVNHLTYHGALQCGSSKVANATFHLSKSVGDSEAWLVEVLSLLPVHSVVFLDTGRRPDDVKWEQEENLREAAMVVKILDTFKQGGVDMSDVGVMSPFRAQANLLRAHTIREHGAQLEVSTIDQFQGKDKNVALLSCVRSFPHSDAPPKERAGILNDLKRLTVALSRARVKVVIIGDAASLRCYAPFCQLFSGLCDEQMVTLTQGERGFDWTQLSEQLQL